MSIQSRVKDLEREAAAQAQPPSDVVLDLSILSDDELWQLRNIRLKVDAGIEPTPSEIEAAERAILKAKVTK